jgi:putative endonuclease
MSLLSKQLGKQAENIACHYLQAKGLTLITRNYTCRFGEIDLIMREKNTYIFLEVRYRNNHAFGHNLETVCLLKQKKIITSAEFYLFYNPLPDGTTCRFDVVSISCIKSSFLQKLCAFKQHSNQVEWIKNAFSR